MPGTVLTVGLPGYVLDIVKCTSVDRQLTQGSELRIHGKKPGHPVIEP